MTFLRFLGEAVEVLDALETEVRAYDREFSRVALWLLKRTDLAGRTLYYDDQRYQLSWDLVSRINKLPDQTGPYLVNGPWGSLEDYPLWYESKQRQYERHCRV